MDRVPTDTSWKKRFSDWWNKDKTKDKTETIFSDSSSIKLEDRTIIADNSLINETDNKEIPETVIKDLENVVVADTSEINNMNWDQLQQRLLREITRNVNNDFQSEANLISAYINNHLRHHDEQTFPSSKVESSIYKVIDDKLQCLQSKSHVLYHEWAKNNETLDRFESLSKFIKAVDVQSDTDEQMALIGKEEQEVWSNHPNSIQNTPKNDPLEIVKDDKYWSKILKKDNPRLTDEELSLRIKEIRAIEQLTEEGDLNIMNKLLEKDSDAIKLVSDRIERNKSFVQTVDVENPSTFNSLLKNITSFVNNEEVIIEDEPVPVNNPPVVENPRASMWDQIKARRDDKNVITSPKLAVAKDDSGSSGQMSDYFKKDDTKKFTSEYNRPEIDKVLNLAKFNEPIEEPSVVAPDWDDAKSPGNKVFVPKDIKGKGKAIDSIPPQTVVEENVTREPRRGLNALWDQIKGRRNDKDVVSTPVAPKLELDTGIPETTNLKVETVDGFSFDFKRK